MITDEKVKKMLNRLDIPEVDELVNDYPEAEREDKTDLDIFVEAIEQVYDLFTSSDTIQLADLASAKSILGKTKYGKEVSMLTSNSGKLIPEFTKKDIEYAKTCFNEFKRLERLYNKLFIYRKRGSAND